MRKPAARPVKAQHTPTVSSFVPSMLLTLYKSGFSGVTDDAIMGLGIE
jgi:hypothetical protein